MEGSDSPVQQKIGTAVGLVFLCIVLVGVFLSTNNFVNNQMNAAQAVIDTPVSAAEGISYKLDFLLHRAASGDWARFIFACLIFLVFASLMSIIIGSWAGTAAHNSPRSFVLLSRKAEEVKTKALEKRRNRWVSFIASIITSVVAGLIARFIFEIANKRWIHLP